ncbi:M23/M56 family metallopeptidase [Tenacibaculum sp.]|nr:M23/M56 family metallopeptidase [Tenacibaculum sp.]
MLFLNRLTFHGINRIILLFLPVFSVIIPFLNSLFPTLSSKIEIPLFEKGTYETINQQLQVIEQPLVVSSFNYSTLLLTTYWLIFIIYFIRIVIQINRLFVLKSTSVIQQKKNYQLVVADVPDIFSYFNWIFIPKEKIELYNSEILEHEKVHIKLKHSWDVMFTEIYIAFFWFNPLVYFYRKSLKSVHEYQADNGVLQEGIKTSKYMELLLQNIEVQKPNTLYNYFNQSILKKRVMMMTKPKSNRFFKFTYWLFLPVCFLLASAFTSPIIDDIEYLNIANDTPSLFPVQNGTKDNISSFYGKVRKHSKKKQVIHSGIDIRGKIGTPIFATANGIISKASLEGNWGNLIIITHNNGFETWYAHLKGFNINKQQTVKKGDIIGYLGNTGRSTGPHLHYEIKQNGKHLNPINYLE